MKSTKTKKPKKDIRYGTTELPKEALEDRNVKVRTNIYFDLDLIKHFKAEAEKSGEGYQTLMNRALREFVFGPSRSSIEQRLSRIEKELFKGKAS